MNFKLASIKNLPLTYKRFHYRVDLLFVQLMLLPLYTAVILHFFDGADFFQ